MQRILVLAVALATMLGALTSEARDASQRNSARGSGNPAVAGARSNTCPQMTMRGTPPASPSQRAVFTLSIPSQPQFTFNWRVSAGSIVIGQGSQSVFVEAPKGRVTATVEIGGVPSTCTNTAQATVTIP